MNITASYFRNTTAILIVYDVNDLNSIQKMNVWYKEAMDKAGKEKPIIMFVGNKKDIGVESKMQIEVVRDFAIKCGNHKVMECSAKDGIGVNEIFSILLDDIMNIHVKDTTQNESNKGQVNINEKKEEDGGCC